MKKVNDLQVRNNRTKVINAITGLYKDEYIKPNGKYNVSRLSKDLILARNSVYKYIQEFEVQE